MTIRILALLLVFCLAACGGDEGDPPLPEPQTGSRNGDRLAAGQLTCLAKAAYFEARGEGERGMAAVAHVVMNRAEHEAYPATPCAVTAQRRGDRCQFSWACDGALGEPTDLDLFLAAQRVADEVAHAGGADPTHGATMFHAARVTPYWTAEAEHTATVGRHLFYTLN